MGDECDRETSGLSFDVLDPAPVGVAVTRGANHQLVYTNATYRAQFGERPIGSPLPKLFADDYRQHYRELFDQVYATGEPVVLTAAPASTDEDDRFFTSSLSRLSFRVGERGVLVVTMEVTDQITVAQQVQALANERSHILRRYQSLMQVSAQIFWVAGPTGDVIEHSASWERVTGQPWEDYQGRGWLKMVHPDDREATVASWENAVATMDVWEHASRLRTADGSYRHFEIKGVPIKEHGRLVEWVGTCADVEQQWQEQRAQQLLDRAAAATADLTNLEEMLGAVAAVIVPEIADGCGVHLVTDLTGEQHGGAPFVVERVATAARPGLHRLPPYSEERLPPDNALVQAARRRRPLARRFPPGCPPPGLAPSWSQQWMVANKANSVLVLPVVVDGVVPVVVTLMTCGDRPPISRTDAALLSRMFDHAHDALSSAIRFQRTHQIALALQHSLLAAPPRLAGLRIEARYRASPAAAEIGGDWYDSFILPDGVPVMAIGDVAGHDLGAAVTMSQLRNMLRALAMDRCEPPGEILTRLNIAMGSLSYEVTATCALARIEEYGGRHQLNYAVAGHPPPLLVTEDGTGRFLESCVNPLLGIPNEGGCRSTVEPLPPGSTVLFYTDGLIERPGENLDDGLERLRLLAGSLARCPVERFCDQVLSGLPTTGLDDIAVIALRLPPDR
ncbi:SpoIIE family protein phosphatase [Nonomuraea salmonea]|uniref:SpoIIE family protein phosphatase n=1 Tax=Nonomuraea salmonea TaxID=46181 RepID=A0ABV5P0I3_9ACTN